MTLNEIENLDKTMLTAEDVAPYLNAKPDNIRWQAHNEPEKLGFPVIVARSRVKIPKEGFVHYCRYGRTATQCGAERKALAWEELERDIHSLT